MAEFLWRERYRVAASTLLGASALLSLLAAPTRPSGSGDQQTLIVIALLLGFGALVAARIRWERLEPLQRLIPAFAVILATLGAVLLGNVGASSDGPVGLAVIAGLILAYIGFVSDPGLALGVAPAVLVVLYLAHRREPARVSIALPLLAVPATAIVGELISALLRRDRTMTTRSDDRLHQLAQLEEVLRRFHRPGSLREAADQVADAAIEIFDVERSTVVLRDSAGDLIPVTKGPTSSGEPDPITAELVSGTIMGTEPRLIPTNSTNGTMLVLPLPTADTPAGIVLVYPVATDDPAFTIDVARLFGVQVGIAIEHLYRIDELSKASTRDALTGIGNRRHADMLLKSLEPGDALVLLDLDFLKTVNDTLGHAAGDQVLQELSGHLRECLRDSDTSARLGGDEFLIVARRAHANPMAVASRVLDGWVGKGGLTTLSAGVALHDADVNSEITFERADAALYRAKAEGKDRAKLWSGETLSGRGGVQPPSNEPDPDDPSTDD